MYKCISRFFECALQHYKDTQDKQESLGVALLYDAENEAHCQPNIRQLFITLQDTCKLNVLIASSHQNSKNYLQNFDFETI